MDTTIQEIFFNYRQSPTHDLSLLQDEVEKVFKERGNRIKELEETLIQIEKDKTCSCLVPQDTCDGTRHCVYCSKPITGF